MGLRDTITNAVSAAFTAVDDLTQTITYNYPGTVVYNPTTGLNTTSSTTVSVKAIFVARPYRYGTDSKVENNSPQILIKASDFTSQLSLNGTFTVSGSRYDIVSWSTDPAQALYTIDVVRSVS